MIKMGRRLIWIMLIEHLIGAVLGRLGRHNDSYPIETEVASSCDGKADHSRI